MENGLIIHFIYSQTRLKVNITALKTTAYLENINPFIF